MGGSRSLWSAQRFTTVVPTRAMLSPTAPVLPERRFSLPLCCEFWHFRFQHGGPGWGAQGEEQQQLPRLSWSPWAEERCCERSTGLLSRGTQSKRQTETAGKSRE